MKSYMKRKTMERLSVSEIQRNLHKLDEYDIVEIVDKKKNVTKGFYIKAQYADLVSEIERKIIKNKQKKAAGLLKRYADPSLRQKEEEAWQKSIIKHYKENL